MISDVVKAKILSAIATGMSVLDAARINNLSTGQGRNALFRICRQLRLSPDLSEIRSDPEKYIKAAATIIDDPKYNLRKDLREKIQKHLRLSTSDEISPKYLSNITASKLLSAGITETALSDIQAWLVSNGTSLKRHAPDNDENTRSVKRAIFLLDSFGFDTSQAKRQLDAFDG